jgi:GNAT superfamily N-acetyltransferase
VRRTQPDLVRAWQVGWGRCRGLEPATDLGGALKVSLGLRGREYEIVVPDDADAERFAAEVARATDPTWLTVFTPDPDGVELALKSVGLETFGAPERFMAVDLSRTSVLTSDVKVTVDCSLIEVAVEENGEIAASGMMGLSGSDAVAHQIRTEPAYRRRGLASVVMSALCQRAMEMGATTGLLVASPEGEQLYLSLGWESLASVVTARSAEGARNPV